MHSASPCSQALINLSKTSCNGQLEGQFAILDVDHDTAHLYQSCDIGDMHPSTINPEVKQSTGCMMTSAWLASGCSVNVDKLSPGAEAHQRHFTPSCVLLQLSVYERRALRWGRLLQLPLVDAFFAAHALGCLTMVAADGGNMSLEVSSHICALGCILGYAAEPDLVEA